jgi:hypothetical protein
VRKKMKMKEVRAKMSSSSMNMDMSTIMRYSGAGSVKRMKRRTVTL